MSVFPVANPQFWRISFFWAAINCGSQRVRHAAPKVLDQSMETCQVRLVVGFEDLKGHFLDVIRVHFDLKFQGFGHENIATSQHQCWKLLWHLCFGDTFISFPTLMCPVYACVLCLGGCYMCGAAMVLWLLLFWWILSFARRKTEENSSYLQKYPLVN